MMSIEVHSCALQRRLEARGVELQADMRSVRHRIDDPAGWEAFSLYSQQQADLEGRLRLVHGFSCACLAGTLCWGASGTTCALDA